MTKLGQIHVNRTKAIQNLLDEILVGNAGNDSLNGGSGNDAILGLSGDDRISGGRGNEVIREEIFWMEERVMIAS